MHDYKPMIFTVPMWGSEVANFKTDIKKMKYTSAVRANYNVFLIKTQLSSQAARDTSIERVTGSVPS